MKRVIGYLFVLILILNCIVISAQQSTSTAEEQGEKLLEDIEKSKELIPFDESGEFNETKLNQTFQFGKSKADERIEKINDWLGENASWLRFLFRMPVEISFLFFWNIMWILTAFTHIYLNAFKYPIFTSETTARLVGFVTFVVMLVLNIYYHLAVITNDTMWLLWNYILPYGILIAIVVTIIAVIAFIAFIVLILPFLPEIMAFIAESPFFRKILERILKKKLMTLAEKKAGLKSSGGSSQGSDELDKRKELAVEQLEAIARGAINK